MISLPDRDLVGNPLIYRMGFLRVCACCATAYQLALPLSRVNYDPALCDVCDANIETATVDDDPCPDTQSG